jgi:GGDEF domain-containing protein
VRIREAIAVPVALEDAEVRVFSSVGTSLYPADAETAADLVAAADRAMYRLKRAA